MSEGGGAPQAGWYEDPVNSLNIRYWSGSGWTDRVRPRYQPPTGGSAIVASQPVPATPAADQLGPSAQSSAVEGSVAGPGTSEHADAPRLTREPSVLPPGPPSYQGQPHGPPSRGTNGLAIASLVLGIVWLWGLGAILALIFGVIARKQIRRTNGQQSGGGLAVAGIVLGAVGVVGAVILTVTIVAASHNLSNNFNTEATCASEFATVQTAVEAYKAQVGQYPTSINQLLSTATLSSGSTVGPWLRRAPVHSGQYQILVSNDGSGGVGVFTTRSNPTQIGSSNTSTDCLSLP